MTEPIVPVPDPEKKGDLAPKGDPAPEPKGDPKDFILPEKFKTPQALLDAYTELERKQSTQLRAPEEYKLTIPDGVTIEDGLKQKMKDGHFTNDQAQIVMDIYKDDILPTLIETTKELEQEKLANSLGITKDKGVEEAQRVLGWAAEQENGKELLELHQSTAAGVLFLRERMLRELDSDRITPPGGPSTKKPDAVGQLSAAEIDRMVQDPRYTNDPVWRSAALEKISKSMAVDVQLESVGG